MSRLPAVVGLGLMLFFVGTAARADDGWNPFKDRDTQSRSERAPATRSRQNRSSDQPAPLPPMDGVGSKSWLDGNSRGGSSPYESRNQEPSGERYPDDRPAPWRNAPGDTAGPADTATSGAATVERTELQPLPPVAGAHEAGPSAAPAARSEPLSADFWNGIDLSKIGEAIAPLSIPPHSAALASLWQRLLSLTDGPPARSDARDRGRAASFDAVRLEALYRSGLVDVLKTVMANRTADSGDPVEALLTARTRIALGDRESGCSAIKGLQKVQGSLPRPARHQFLLLAALCGVTAADASKAGLAADLLRAEGVSEPLALASLDALASGKPDALNLPAAKTLSLLDYRFLELINADPPLAGAEPALLSWLATGAKSPATRVLAAEAALAIHAIRHDDLAKAYRAASFPAPALAQPFAAQQPPPLQRALLFQAIEAEREPLRKARFVRALLDEIRRANAPYQHVAAMLAPAVAGLRPSRELSWFAETAIEIGIAGGRIDAARDWATAPAGPQSSRFEDWLALADISAPNWRGHRGEFLRAVEQRAVSGHLAPALMHRLVTVLDALDYQIPIPLWEAASKTPQPATGFLPETGVLSLLQQASKQHEQANTILLSMRALGPDNAETVHMIALGDTIRALKRAGFETEARQLGLEALFMAWPRAHTD